MFILPLGYRSRYRDLEAQVAVLTQNEGLQQQLEKVSFVPLTVNITCNQFDVQKLVFEVVVALEGWPLSRVAGYRGPL